MKRPIHISLGPNYEKDDVLLALKTLFNPLKWLDKKEVEKLEKEFGEVFGRGEYYQALAVNSGRSAQYLILKALEIGKGDEVLVQDFTCVAVPNSASWLGAKPISVGTGEDYNFDYQELKQKTTSNTRAVIVQNTFGFPANHKKIADAVGSKVEIINDYAHSLGIKITGKTAFFSFGRDKVISSVFGGMIITSDDTLFNRIKRLRNELKDPPLWWVVQQLLHPIALTVILPLYLLPLYLLPSYSFGIGKILLVILQKLNILSRAVYPEEKSGGHPGVFPTKMPAALAVLARHQLKKLERFNAHRKKIAKHYFDHLSTKNFVLPPNRKEAVYLRFPIRVDNAQGLIKFARKKGVILGDWYKESDSNVVNLPTYPTMTLKDAEKVVQLVKEWLNTQHNS